jgi:peptidoglycan/xylan/chitin deacetylase (PgdA/CDA1 family)
MILLGFDVEEFDMPMEYGKSLSFDEQLSISTNGTNSILDLLRSANVKATFFCTANYANHKPDIISRIVTEGHEIASHGYYHSDFKPEHLKQSKQVLEDISGTEVSGFRMARMMPVDETEIEKAGYSYNSSINPTWLPGRYNNFDKPRTWFYIGGVLQIPASVSPLVRFPLFWLSFHNLPLAIIKWISSAAHRKDGYLNLYFHPWEFTDLHNKEKFGFPGYVSKNSGAAFIRRIKNYIAWAQSKGYQFARTGDFAAQVMQKESVIKKLVPVQENFTGHSKDNNTISF